MAANVNPQNPNLPGKYNYSNEKEKIKKFLNEFYVPGPDGDSKIFVYNDQILKIVERNQVFKIF